MHLLKIIINCADAQFEHSGSIIMGTDDILKLHQYAPNLKIIASHLDTVGHATFKPSTIKRIYHST